MEGAAKGARSAGVMTIGILPGFSRLKQILTYLYLFLQGLVWPGIYLL
jgi:predicted Rossmann-fold nucleotide-binding protein